MYTLVGTNVDLNVEEHQMGIQSVTVVLWEYFQGRRSVLSIPVEFCFILQLHVDSLSVYTLLCRYVYLYAEEHGVCV